MVPNERGRVVDPDTGMPVRGAYVAGWIKRGPTGFIGTNKSCALETVQELVADFNAGLLTDPADRPAASTNWSGRGSRMSSTPPVGRPSTPPRSPAAPRRRPRNKFTDVADMLAAAATAPKPTVRRTDLTGRG